MKNITKLKPVFIHHFIIIILSGLLITACSDEKTNPEKKKDRPQRVEIIHTQYATVAIERRFNASVQAPNTIRITNQVAGLIINMPARTGSVVKKGDLLIQLDDSLTKAEYQKASASLEKARQDLQRLSNLAARQLASAEELASATTALKLAEAEASLKQTQLRYSVIRAPFNGVISQHNYETHDTASLNSHLLTLVDNSRLIVKTNIPESMLTSIKQGDACKVEVPSSGLELNSRIQTIYPVVDPQTLQITLELSLDNTSQTLYPGQFAEAIISSNAVERLLLPVNAIQYDTRGPWVFVVDKDKVREQRVTIGQHFENSVEILSGLDTNIRVVTRGFVGLRAGKKVTYAGAEVEQQPAKEVTQ